MAKINFSETERETISQAIEKAESKTSGEIVPVIASYNAGENRVAEWWAGTRHLRDDFFVDSIPYSETRRFAREVIANQVAYNRVYGAPN